MNRRTILGLVLLAQLVHPGASRAEAASSELGAFLDTYTATWNRHDGGALAALFTADADVVMGNLPRIEGREAIAASWSGYFSRIDERRMGEFELVSWREIAPGVLRVNVRTTTAGTNERGEELETRLARGTWVLVREGETWRIAAMRGLPAEGEPRVRPGTDR